MNRSRNDPEARCRAAQAAYPRHIIGAMADELFTAKISTDPRSAGDTVDAREVERALADRVFGSTY